MKDLHPQRTAPITSPEFSDAALEDEETIDLAHYWRVVRRHKWGILTITLLALIAGILYAISATPIYKPPPSTSRRRCCWPTPSSPT